MIKLVIVDDHALFREGLASILTLEPDIKIEALAGSVREAVDIVGEKKPDIVLMDYSLPDGTGADATDLILEIDPNCKIIFLTMSEKDDNLFSAIRSGAKGYLLKNMSPSKLVAAIRSVHQGESAISRAMTLRLMEELSRTQSPGRIDNLPLESLTDREAEVLKEVAKGFTNKEIAESLVISINTVKYHVRSILSKLDLPDRKAAASFMKEDGLRD